MHLEVVVVDGVAQVVLEAEPVELARVHVGIEQLVARLAARLRVIHGGVGIAHDLVGVVVLGAAEGDADARGGEDFPPADRKGRAQRVLNAERDGVGLILVAELVQENRELVSAQPGERVALPQARLEAARHRRQQLVAHQVAETVVDDLEAVEVEIERRESAAAAPVL